MLIFGRADETVERYVQALVHLLETLGIACRHFERGQFFEFGGLVGILVYFYSMQSALKAAVDRREQIISALSSGEGPIEN